MAKTIYQKLAEVQDKLFVPKGQENTFGHYNYRSCEDILVKVKPLLKANGLVLTLHDELVCIGQFNYVKARAEVFDLENESAIYTEGYAREAVKKSGMDDSQITGTASSYARKYALNGLFAIDNTKDADTDEYCKRVKDAEDAEKKLQEALDARIADVNALKTQKEITAYMVAHKTAPEYPALRKYVSTIFNNLPKE